MRRGIIVEDEAWNDQSNKDVEMALLFPFAPSTSPSVMSEENDDDDDAARYFTYNNDNNQRGQKPVQQDDQLDWRNMLSPSTYPDSLHDNTSFDDFATLISPMMMPHSDSPSGYESLRDSDFDPDDPYYRTLSPLRAPSSHDKRGGCGSTEYEGVEGIYRFLQVCEDVRR